ncbi:zinc ribbon domain-containing protein [Hymenobacter busanensis]|uniref:Zinc ribbon domain-containing protein n=1 Tax=Hymenobacter busanensis TaxID=2607656 RepID=A0A7L5A2D4_9BACT|nr:zinc ribbon domain-containing protein [Hymenobacter busanensis]KAA9338388.1 zinc ribbon domain-containing protein [Hymenobacter busanensis]QHJ09185.1 hypothetical protein GUY19_18590 [Hymenobacter busanensis]
MLEPDEFSLVMEAKQNGLAVVERERQRRQAPVPEQLELDRVAEHFRAMLEMYRLLTGFEETNPNAVWHHATDQYGPPCPQCHKPLRTPEARYCPQCGFGKHEISADPRPLRLKRSELFSQ